MGIFDSITRGYAMTVASIRIASKEPWMFFLPVISGVIMLALILSFIFVPGTLGLYGSADSPNQATIIVAVALLYFIGYFLFYFTSAMVVFGARERFEGRDPTIGQSFSQSLARIDKILLLSLIGAIIGVLMQLLSGRGKNGRPNIIGQILASLIGVAWTVVSYFSLPVILNEQIGVIDSFKKSYELVKKSWGEGVSANISLLFIYVPGALLLLAGIFLLGGTVGLAIIVLGGLLLLIAYMVSIPVKAVISEALYVYATKGVVPSGFEADHLASFYQGPQGLPGKPLQ